MVYRIFWILVNLSRRVYFRHFFYSNAKNIPRDRPVILACNHPNSFLDGMSIGSSTKDTVHFFARGDAFNTPLKMRLLGMFHVHPIFRLQEGKENLAKNDESFEKGYRILDNNGILLIHSEGICVVEKRIRPVKKGTARMAFNAEDKFNFLRDLTIVPVGFNYTYPTKFRGEQIIQVGQPFETKEFREIYLENPAKAINQFNARLMVELEKVVISISKKEDEELVEKLLLIGRNEIPLCPFSWFSTSEERFKLEKNIADKVNHWSENNHEVFRKLKTDVDTYSNYLKKYNLSDRVIKKPNGHLFLRYLLLLGFLPVFPVGYFGNNLPLLLAARITKKVVVGDVFHDSVKLGSGMVLYLVYYLLIIIPVAILCPWWVTLLTALLPVYGYYSIFYRELYFAARHYRAFHHLKKAKIGFHKELKEMRDRILANLYVQTDFSK